MRHVGEFCDGEHSFRPGQGRTVATTAEVHGLEADYLLPDGRSTDCGTAGQRRKGWVASRCRSVGMGHHLSPCKTSGRRVSWTSTSQISRTAPWPPGRRVT